MRPQGEPGRGALGLSLMMVSVLAVALMPNGAKLAYEAGSNTMTVLVLRSGIGALLLGIGALVARGSLGLPGHLVPRVLVTGVAATVTSLGFYGAIAYIEISLAILIIFTHPLVIAVILHLRGDTRLTARQALSGLAAFGGLALALSVDFSNLVPLGVGLAAMGSLGATAMVLLNAQVVQRVGSLLSNFYMTVTSLVILTLALVLFGETRLPIGGLGWIGAIATGVAFAVAYATFFAAARIIGVSRASLLSILEPIPTILLAMALFGEQLSAFQRLGVALVVGGLFFMELPEGALRRLIGRRPRT